jgi:CRISPR system Cascade subunit CasC
MLPDAQRRNLNMKNYINYHVLISHSPSCLNRDDMNMQKSTVFGGVRRVRISSQSLKRAIRTSDYYRQHLGEPSQRTRKLGRFREKCIHAFKGRFSDELVSRVITALSGKEEISDATEADAVAPWILAEVEKLCELIEATEKEGGDVDKLFKQIGKDSVELRRAIAQAVDVALSGRMATSGRMMSVDGALAVAHVFTTHAVDGDIDWFTAVDDMVSEAGETGAGHLNTQEFSSGVFYRYASLNLRQLQENLGGAPRERALEIASHMAHLLATVVPSAKQQSFAAHNLADAVLVTVGDMPISLANAFEQPVRANGESGFRAPSLQKLLQHWRSARQAYELDQRARLFALDDLPTEGEPARVATLSALKEWIARDAQD